MERRLATRVRCCQVWMSLTGGPPVDGVRRCGSRPGTAPASELEGSGCTEVSPADRHTPSPSWVAVGGERDVLAVELAGGQAVVQTAEQPTRDPSQRLGVAVAGGAAPVVQGTAAR